MYRHLMMILCSFSALFAYTDEQAIDANLTDAFFDDFIEMYLEIDKYSFSGPDGTIYSYFSKGEDVKFIVAFDPEKNNHKMVRVLKKVQQSYYEDKKYNFIDIQFWQNKNRGTITKRTANIFNSEYFFDQQNRLKRFKSIDNEVLFLYRKDYISKTICINNKVEYKSKMFVKRFVLGEEESYVLKDFKGSPIAVVVDSKLYQVVTDYDGSIRKVIDPDTGGTVAEYDFSSEGHLIKFNGELYKAPYCFRGMYQEKISELYFDVDTYYDPDLRMFLEND